MDTYTCIQYGLSFLRVYEVKQRTGINPEHARANGAFLTICVSNGAIFCNFGKLSIKATQQFFI